MRSRLLMFLLLLSILIHDAQGLRLVRKGTAPSAGLHSLHQEEFEGVSRDEGKWKSKKFSGKWKGKLYREEKESHSQQRLPRIHEDYYGPRMHRSKHH